MFAIVKNKTIVSLLQAGSAFRHDDLQYPANWINIAKPEQKAVIGLVDVVRAERPNDKYYWVTETEPVYNEATNQVEIGYTATPKDLDAAKADAINEVKSGAFAVLAPTDYIDVRNLRDPAYKPEWITWRDAVRAASGAQVEAINACETIEALAALDPVVWPANPDAPAV